MIVAANTCLLVIDMQNDFLAPEGYYGTKKDISPMIKAKENLGSFIKKAFGKIPIIFIQAEYGPQQFGAGKFICLKDSWGQKIVFDKKYATKIIKKHLHSAFSNIGLKTYLQEKKIDTLLISGVTTENCVRATTLDSVKNGFKTILLEDCVGTNNELAENQQKVFDELNEDGVLIIKSERLVFDVLRKT